MIAKLRESISNNWIAIFQNTSEPSGDLREVIPNTVLPLTQPFFYLQNDKEQIFMSSKKKGIGYLAQLEHFVLNVDEQYNVIVSTHAIEDKHHPYSLNRHHGQSIILPNDQLNYARSSIGCCSLLATARTVSLSLLNSRRSSTRIATLNEVPVPKGSPESCYNPLRGKIKELSFHFIWNILIFVSEALLEIALPFLLYYSNTPYSMILDITYLS